MENIERKFFHGIDISGYEYPDGVTAIKVLESILETGKIYTRNEFFNTKNDPHNILYHISRSYNQEDDEVCLAFHPSNNDFPVRIDEPDYNAFKFFILDNISFIFSEQIIANREYKVMGMPREFRIKGSLELSGNLEAIGCRDKINPLIMNLEKILEREDYDNLREAMKIADYNYILRASDTKKYVKDKYKRYNEIKELLLKYKYKIPIVDPLTGQEYEEDIIKAEEIVSKTRIMLRKLK